MMSLDLRTIVVMTGAVGVLLALVMLALRLSYPRHIKGLGTWSLGLLLIGLANFLFAARDSISNLQSVLGANVSLMSGALLLLFGTQRFFEVRPRYGLWLPLMLVALPLLVYVSVIEQNFNMRVILITFLWICILLAQGLTVWRHGPEVFSTRFTAVVILVHIFVIGMRMLTAMLPLPGEGPFQATRIQTFYVASSALIMIALMVGLVLMVAERVRRELEHYATRDPLTGATLRAVLIASAEQEFHRCRRHGRSMAVMLLDIDRFKDINDTYGHRVGDKVLVDIAQRVRAALRRHDQLGRYGGEEFIVLLPETRLDVAQLVAGRIRSCLAQSAEGVPGVTVSIGMTTNRNDDQSIDMLLARADLALFQAKADGRDRVVAT